MDASMMLDVELARETDHGCLLMTQARVFLGDLLRLKESAIMLHLLINYGDSIIMNYLSWWPDIRRRFSLWLILNVSTNRDPVNNMCCDSSDGAKQVLGNCLGLLWHICLREFLLHLRVEICVDRGPELKYFVETQSCEDLSQMCDSY